MPVRQNTYGIWIFPCSVSKNADFQRTHNQKSLFQSISFLHCSPFLIGHKIILNLEQGLQKDALENGQIFLCKFFDPSLVFCRLFCISEPKSEFCS
jgi:hypothetical protein